MILHRMNPTWLTLAAITLAAIAAAAQPANSQGKPPARKPTFDTRPGQRLQRLGDEIMVCGQLFHTGTRIVLWTDPGGYDAYRVERRFSKWEAADWQATTRASEAAREKVPNRYNIRESVLTPEEFDRVRGGGWDLPLLQDKVDQFVLHYDVCGVSRLCFQVLQDNRFLSVHFLLDIDGTVYQTLDLKERAWHATVSNSRSVGVEIANMGSYAANDTDPFKMWYTKDADGKMRIAIPDRLGDGGVLTPNFIGRPARDRLVWGDVQGKRRRQWDYTPEQYEALTKLTATLCTVLPKIRCDYPRDDQGRVITHKLDDETLEKFQGVLGHYHVQADKQDPGPALQWDRVINGARKLMEPHPTPKDPPTPRPIERVSETRPAKDDNPHGVGPASNLAHDRPELLRPLEGPTSRPTTRKSPPEPDPE
jgi:N-acetyl-anhydromuramyl-L-alanine amidase AmpD